MCEYRKLDKLHSVLKAIRTELLPLSRSLMCRMMLMHIQVKELLINCMKATMKCVADCSRKIMVSNIRQVFFFLRRHCFVLTKSRFLFVVPFFFVSGAIFSLAL